MKEIFKYNTGDIIGKCVLLEIFEIKSKYVKIKAKCECGSIFIARYDKIKNGSGCGCRIGGQLKNDKTLMLKYRTKHGYAMSGKVSSEYTTWLNIRNRCNDSKNKAYKLYGGRGIKVCERWLIFANFIADMGNKPSIKHSIDRIDTNGNYEPGNCRWTTKLVQARNTRTNNYIEYNGEKRCIAEWGEIFGIRANVITKRLLRGWPIEKALTSPLDTYVLRKRNSDYRTIIS